MKIKLILNPAAGQGASKKVGQRVRDYLNLRDIDFSYDKTYRQGGGTLIAKKAIDLGFNLIVAIGGDGTVNEVANGIMGSNATLAIVPCGTGNDFSKMLGLKEDDPEEACRTFLEGETKQIDVGRINDPSSEEGWRYFLNGVGIGLDAQIANEATKAKERFSGLAIYIVGFLKSFMRCKSIPVSVTLKDGTLKTSVMIITVANGRCFGGAFYITPNAEIDDGLFDVCLINKINRLKILRYLPKLFKGEHLSLPYTMVVRTDKVTIDSPRELPIHIDGEFIKSSRPHEIELLPKKLKVKIKENARPL